MKKRPDRFSREEISNRVSLVGIIGNVVLTLFKLFAGIVAHSGAMVSDAIHSASDVLSTFIVMISIKFAGKDADDKHPYGHERFECVAALLLSFLLCATGIGIGVEGMKKIASHELIAAPGALALIAAGVSIVTKEAMYVYTIRAAKKINSSALRANAWDHRSDAFSSIGSFAGILGAKLGYPKLDAVASVIIAAFILKISYDIFLDAVNKMMDHSCSKDFIEKIRVSICEDHEVVSIDDIKTRLFGDKVYVDVEISVDGNDILYDAHNVAKRAHDRIEHTFPEVKHCMIHVNPAKIIGQSEVLKSGSKN